MSRKKAPKSVVKRLPVYLRILDNLIRRDVEIISSRVLSDETGFTAEQKSAKICGETFACLPADP